MHDKMNIAAVKHIQSVLEADEVAVHTAGRLRLADRKSLCFIAEQASLLQRPGFAVDGVVEKYRIQGGLLADELDDLFRSAAGHKAEQDLRLAVHDWVKGKPVTSNDGFPVDIRKQLQVPPSVTGLNKIATALKQGNVYDFAESAGLRPLPANKTRSISR